MASQHPILKKVVSVLLGMFLVFILLEAGLRLGGFLLLTFQERANLRSIQQNGEFRILCLGESTTQGEYPPFLEKDLNEHKLGVKVSVIDKGLTGTNTVAILRGLEDNLNKYRPDVVVTMMGCNDWMTLYYQDIPEANSWIFKHCRVYRFGRILLMNVLKKLKKADAGPAFKKLPKSSHPGKPRSQQTKAQSLHVKTGWLYQQQGKLSEAEHEFRKALELDSKDQGAYGGLGRIYKDQTNYPEAEPMFKRVIELDPGNASAYTELGGLYKEQGKYAEAETMLQKAVALDPAEEKAYHELGRLYNHLKKYTEAEQATKKAIELDPWQGELYILLAWVYRDQAKLSEAAGILHQAVQRGLDYAPVYTALGQVHRRQGRLSEAEQAFKKAVELDPKGQVAYGGLATVYGAMGKKDLSKAYAERVNDLSGKCYNPVTAGNYRRLKKILDRRHVGLVCVQYPMRSLQSLENIFPGEDVIFVDNERTFRDAVHREGYGTYFRDAFAGDFGHCTEKGNRLLAANIADVIVKRIFKK